MKNFVCTVQVLILAFCLILSGCKPKDQPKCWYAEDGRIKVLSTTAMIGNLVEAIGGDHLDSLILIRGESDPHSYELVKGDDEKFSSADILFANGLNLEHGASLRHQLQSQSHVVYLGSEVEKKVPTQVIRVNGEKDPHVWMDISLWVEAIDAVVEALSTRDKAHSVEYRRNGDQCRQEMLQTHYQIMREMKQIPEEKRYLVTSHDAFRYFVRAYLSEEEQWQKRCVAPEGLAPEGQLSLHDIKKVIDHISSHQIKVVFPESNLSKDALSKIISAAPHPVRCSRDSLYGDTMGTKTYLEMISHNANVLIGEWSQ